ncbi:anti-repressor Ant [Armadillidium vulgare iridescent virus]|uniref:BRO-like protein n=1 Tax=Armadillidium vulgare iridescent virus TaxID=72201 RepID=A0A068QLP2_9VIRU|nr:anti-repressor Ant [Armadillidium vulgare iridescent virus]CCV02424.1 BRO-like protein [Armadillidium vulgare iridescent virus]
MNALINLNDCKEYMTIALQGRQHQVKLAGTVDTPYFCGKDICEVLGYKNLKDALQKHVDDEDKTPLQNLQGGMSRSSHLIIGQSYDNLSYNDGRAVYISEGGLYSLIISSQAPFAKDFRRLVCNVILPSIRKYGSYSIEEQLSSVMKQLALKDKSEEELRIAKDEAELREQQERQRADEATLRLRSETKRGC